MNLLQKIDSGIFNVGFMGLCFFLLFTADLTIVNMEKTIISSIHDDNEEFEVDGYNLLSLLYIAFGITLWLAPSALSVFGLRTSMVIASLIYTIYIASFGVEKSWAVYSATAIGGIGAGLLWAAEGKYLVLNSTPEVVSRNIGIFWTFFCSSSFFGNIFAYYQLNNKKYVDRESRRRIIYALTFLSAIATMAFLLLRPVKSNKDKEKKSHPTNPLSELKKTWGVFKTKEMLILSITFCFTGLQQAFSSGVYSPTIGFTLQFGNSSKQLVPLSGFMVGIGQLLGGGWQIVQGQNLSKKSWGRKVVLITGVIAELICFFLVLINIPSSAVFGNTNDTAIISSNIYVALFCSLLLGLGDGCLNTQNFSILAIIYPEASAQSCALYKFTKAVFVAIGYAISSCFNLHYQIGLLTLFGIAGLMAYIFVDTIAVKKVQTSTERSVTNEEI